MPKKGEVKDDQCDPLTGEVVAVGAVRVWRKEKQETSGQQYVAPRIAVRKEQVTRSGPELTGLLSKLSGPACSCVESTIHAYMAMAVPWFEPASSEIPHLAQNYGSDTTNSIVSPSSLHSHPDRFSFCDLK